MLPVVAGWGQAGELSSRIVGLQQLTCSRPAGGREDMANGCPVKAHAYIALAIQQVTCPSSRGPQHCHRRSHHGVHLDGAEVSAVFRKIAIIAQYKKLPWAQ